MNKHEELTLWSAQGWLTAGNFEIQGLVVADLADQVSQGMSLDKALNTLSVAKNHAGDFGIEIAGTLLAPILVTLLKDFWSGYLKKLGEKTEDQLADFTVAKLKTCFLTSLSGEQGDSSTVLKASIERLQSEKKIDAEQAKRLLAVLNNSALIDSLSS